MPLRISNTIYYMYCSLFLRPKNANHDTYLSPRALYKASWACSSFSSLFPSFDRPLTILPGQPLGSVFCYRDLLANSLRTAVCNYFIWFVALMTIHFLTGLKILSQFLPTWGPAPGLPEFPRAWTGLKSKHSKSQAVEGAHRSQPRPRSLYRVTFYYTLLDK